MMTTMVVCRQEGLGLILNLPEDIPLPNMYNAGAGCDAAVHPSKGHQARIIHYWSMRKSFLWAMQVVGYVQTSPILILLYIYILYILFLSSFLLFLILLLLILLYCCFKWRETTPQIVATQGPSLLILDHHRLDLIRLNGNNEASIFFPWMIPIIMIIRRAVVALGWRAWDAPRATETIRGWVQERSSSYFFLRQTENCHFRRRRRQLRSPFVPLISESMNAKTRIAMHLFLPKQVCGHKELNR